MTFSPYCSRSPTGGDGPNDGPVREHIVGAAACVPTTAETPAAKVPPLSSSNVATVVSNLAGMGVHFSLKLQREANESQRAGDDPANSRGPQAGRRPACAAPTNSDAQKSGAARQAEVEASGFR